MRLLLENDTAGGLNDTDSWETTLMELDIFIHSTLAIGVAFLCTLIASCISIFTIYKHLTTYTHPSLQKNIIRVLFIVPFYASLSWFSLVIPSASIYLESIRDIWEAFVVYCFLNLMLEYCGGENSCVSVIMNHPGAISHIWPFGYCLPEIPLDARFMRLCKRFTIQFVVTKPIMAIINLVVLSIGRYEDRGYQVVQMLVYNISYTAALYSLLLFFFATHEHPGVKSRNPLLKFVSVKMIVFATYYQGLLVALIPGVDTDSLILWNNFILCCEMVIFAALHFFAFGWKEFRSGGTKPNGIGNTSGTGTGTKKSSEHAFSNARDVLSMKDVASDAYYNFNGKYGSHVLLETDTEYVLGDDTEIIEDDVPIGTESAVSGSDLSGDMPITPPLNSKGASNHGRGSSGKPRTFKTKSFLFGNMRNFGSTFIPRSGNEEQPPLDDRIQGFGDTSALTSSIELPVSHHTRQGRKHRNSSDASTEDSHGPGGGNPSVPIRPPRTMNPFADSETTSQQPSTSQTSEWADFSSMDDVPSQFSATASDTAVVEVKDEHEDHKEVSNNVTDISLV